MIWNIFKPVELTDKIYNKFIDTGKVPDSIIRLIAFKIIERKVLTEKEMAVFYACTGEVENMLAKITKK